MSLSDALSFAISCLLWGIALLVIVTGTLAFAHPVNAQSVNLTAPSAQTLLTETASTVESHL